MNLSPSSARQFMRALSLNHSCQRGHQQHGWVTGGKYTHQFPSRNRLSTRSAIDQTWMGSETPLPATPTGKLQNTCRPSSNAVRYCAWPSPIGISRSAGRRSEAQTYQSAGGLLEICRPRRKPQNYLNRHNEKPHRRYSLVGGQGR